jgi:hypothetical protein
MPRPLGLRSPVLALLLAGAACTTAAGDASDSTTTTSTGPTGATLPRAEPLEPVPYEAPTTTRVMRPDVPDVIPPHREGSAGQLFPLGPSEVLSSTLRRTPDGGSELHWWVVDLEDGSTEELEPPPVEQPVDDPGGLRSVSFDFADGLGLLVVPSCPAEPPDCEVPRFDFWGLHGPTRSWTEIGSIDPRDVVGEGWDPGWLTTGGLRYVGGKFLLQLADETELAESVAIAFDPATGGFAAVEEGAVPPWPTSHEMTPGPHGDQTESCDLADGGESRIRPETDWALETRAADEEDWRIHDDLAPALLTTCGESSVWTRVADQWTRVELDGTVSSSVAVPLLLDESVKYREQLVLGAGTDQVVLLVRLSHDFERDLESETHRIDLIVIPAGTSEPIVVESSGYPGAGPLEALQLPGGAIVMPAPDEPDALLVVE